MSNNTKLAETKQAVKKVAKATKDNTKKVVKNSVHDLKHGSPGINPKKKHKVDKSVCFLICDN
ncbi:hypothetical protein [Leuconostoc mesenteroides]|uniref:hypothetical protein n=1 Tax=Leuconostoc mesenteroides TaxID=1245 RepID=UPI0023619A61|nr:hypothetical protein [Leuconostoc mesenteroides]